jgi:hypothetical protein
MAQLTGMPAGVPKASKPAAVRRGGGRHKAPGSPKGLTPQQHLANATSALKAGNHAAAKTSALHLANALHAMSKPKGVPNAATTSPTAAPPIPDQDPTSGF